MQKLVMPSEELQKKYLQLQMFRQQLQVMLEEKGMIDEKLSEMAMTMAALRELDNMKKGEEIWSSMGSGAFVRSDIKDLDKVLVSVGAGVVLKETRPKAIEILKSRMDELSQLNAELVTEINKLGEEVARLEPVVQKLAEEGAKQ